MANINIPFYIDTTDNRTWIPVGILPGLNSVIDPNYNFEKNLLTNISFIDFIPVVYRQQQISRIIDSITSIASYAVTGKEFKEAKTAVQKLFDIPINGLYEYDASGRNEMAETFKKILEDYLDFKFSSTNFGIKVIASNDSVFSENLQNDFNENQLLTEAMNNPLIGGSKAIVRKNIDAINNFIQKTAHVNVMHTVASLPKYSYADALSLLKNFAHDNTFSSILQKEYLGFEIALPRIFRSSRYTNSLNVFIKLTSPSGHPDDVFRYVINPLKLLILMAAPLSGDGMTYFVPPIWQIKSHGNSFMKVGVIDVITVTRGSMETSYSDLLLPTSIDVRITISSLSDHFATVLNKEDLNKNEVGLTTVETNDEVFNTDTNNMEELYIKL